MSVSVSLFLDCVFTLVNPELNRCKFTISISIILLSSSTDTKVLNYTNFLRLHSLGSAFFQQYNSDIHTSSNIGTFQEQILLPFAISLNQMFMYIYPTLD